MKAKLLLLGVALSMSAAAFAEGEYGRCSRTVQDHCLQDMSRESDTRHGPPAHRQMGAHGGHGHAARHHRHHR